MKNYLVKVRVYALVDITLNASSEKEAKELVKKRGLYWNDNNPDDKHEYFPRIGGGGNEVEYLDDPTFGLLEIVEISN